MAAPGANTPFTLANTMSYCGIMDTKASRIATELFDEDFTSCMDKTYVEVDNYLKSYSTLTAAHGQIRLTPGHKKNIKAFLR